MGPSENPALGATLSPRIVAIAVAIIVGAAAIRVAGARNDLWLDEIWALEVAGGISSPLEVFTGLHHEINHYLNTLWLYAAGDHGNWFGYRVPSVAAGIATVLLAGVIGRRRSVAAAVLGMAVVGASFPLVLYSGEARGYATCVFFAFLCFDLLERNLQSRTWPTAAGYALAATLGLVSHVIFASVVVAGLAWTIERCHAERWPLRDWIGRIATCHLPPLLALALLYAIDIRYIRVGGGSATTSWIDSYGTALAWSLGAPLSPWFQLVACLLAIVVFVAGLRVVARERRDPRSFFVGVIVVFPLLLTFLRGSDVVYPRHFLIAIAFLLLLFGCVLASLCERGTWGRVAAGLALAAYLFANGLHVAQLLRHGRGQPSEILQLLAERTVGPTISVGSDHDFRIGTVLAFHARSLPSTKSLDYRPQDAWPPEGPEWVITHKEPLDAAVPADPQIHDAAGHRYALEAIFPSAPLSGVRWFLYRNVEHR